MAERLRILHCLRAPVGGLFRHVRDLACAQAVLGHAVGVVCDATTHDPLTRGRLDALAPHLALGLREIPMSREIGPSDVRATRTVRKLAIDLGLDIVHGHGAKGGAYARLAGRLLARQGRRVGIFYTPHGGSLHYDPASLVGRAYMAAERGMAALTDGIVFESDYAARTFRAKVGPVACPTRVVHNGVLPDEFVPVPPDADAADLVFVGELRHLKGVDVLIEAVAMAATQPPCRLVIVGTGPDRATFEALVASRGLGERIVFAGAMPARDAFRRGRVLVLPSRAESLPYVALEAAGAGLPLIATAVGGLPEIVAGTDTDLVVPGDPAALAAAITGTLADPTAAAGRAARLQARIAQGFSVEAMTQAILAFYQHDPRRAVA